MPPSPSPSRLLNIPISSSAMFLPPSGLLACLCYMFCSTALTLSNKHIFSTPDLDYPWMILIIQSLFVYILLVCFLIFNRQPIFIFHLFKQMFFPCCLFILYIFTNSRALRSVSLPILSVLKSLAPMGLAIVERFIFADQISPGVIFAMLLIVSGNTVTVLHDMESSFTAYIWAFTNVIINILHVLSLRVCLSDDFTPIQKAVHSNLIAASIMMPFAAINNEIRPFFHDFANTSVTFRVVFVASSVMCAGIGASVFWVVQTTSGSTLSFVGACNKFLVVILGGFLFHVNISPMGWVSVLFGVSAGVVFAVEKSKLKIKGAGAKTSPVLKTEDDLELDIGEVNVKEGGVRRVSVK